MIVFVVVFFVLLNRIVIYFVIYKRRGIKVEAFTSLTRTWACTSTLRITQKRANPYFHYGP